MFRLPLGKRYRPIPNALTRPYTYRATTRAHSRAYPRALVNTLNAATRAARDQVDKGEFARVVSDDYSERTNRMGELFTKCRADNFYWKSGSSIGQSHL